MSENWLFASAFIVASIVIGAVTGGHLSWILPTAAIAGVVAAAPWFAPESLAHLKATLSSRPSSRGNGNVLWRDAEAALRELDRHIDRDSRVARLARSGRLAVEHGRATPTDPIGERARALLCTAAEALGAAPGTNTTASNQDQLFEQCGRAADELDAHLADASNDKALRVRLRVMERQLARKRDD